jgi:acetylornithine deacetylase/succinyl-diaminopimelate desuccinylase-like protein
LVGSGTVAEMLWARPSVNILGMNVPPVVGSSAALQAEASARVSLRVPPGTDAVGARDLLVEHLRQMTPWNCEVDFDVEEAGQPFRSSTDGPGYRAMAHAMQQAFGAPMTSEGQGGSIPLCNVFQSTLPEAEIMLMGVEEPQCLIHAPNESVDPSEIEHLAHTEALFLQTYPSSR